MPEPTPLPKLSGEGDYKLFDVITLMISCLVWLYFKKPIAAIPATLVPLGLGGWHFATEPPSSKIETIKTLDDSDANMARGHEIRLGGKFVGVEDGRVYTWKMANKSAILVYNREIQKGFMLEDERLSDENLAQIGQKLQ